MGHSSSLFFFFNDTATTEIYTLSLHDALPISQLCAPHRAPGALSRSRALHGPGPGRRDRKSTRLNSSHLVISYAVFCLKKKKGPPDASARSELRRDYDDTRSLSRVTSLLYPCD